MGTVEYFRIAPQASKSMLALRTVSVIQGRGIEEGWRYSLRRVGRL
ncbi:MAG: hypothetical protein O7G88_02965 [bacterium]|nr:hypothetical protein [bacterium]